MIDVDDSGEDASKEHFMDYASLLTAAETEGPALPRGVYLEAVATIAGAREYASKRGMNPGEQATALEADFVAAEDDPRLATFAKVLIDAPRQAWSNGQLSLLRSRIDAGTATSETKVTIDALKLRVTTFNHGLRNVILNADNQFTRPELAQWLTEAAGGQYPRWARDQLAGATAEVALYRSLESSPSVSNLGWTSVAEDLRGVDMRLQFEAQAVDIDVKYGDKYGERAVQPVLHNGRLKVVMSVPDEMIGDLGPSKLGEAELPLKLATVIAAYQRS